MIIQIFAVSLLIGLGLHFLIEINLQVSLSISLILFLLAYLLLIIRVAVIRNRIEFLRKVFESYPLAPTNSPKRWIKGIGRLGKIKTVKYAHYDSTGVFVFFSAQTNAGSVFFPWAKVDRNVEVTKIEGSESEALILKLDKMPFPLTIPYHNGTAKYIPYMN